MSYENYFLNSLILTLIVEIPILYIYVKYIIKNSENLNSIFVGIIASCLTLPYLWFILPVYISDRISYLIIGELAIVLVEAIIYFKLLKLKFGQAFLISLVANALSVFVGMMIM